MSRNAPATTEKKGQRKPDQRSQRTRQRLGTAFVELIHEKPIEDVTVQDVLDRTSIGRSTFYLHFRDKNDLLLSQLEMFAQHMSTRLIVTREQSHRVMPVEEMFDHIASQQKLWRILADAGRLPDFLELAQLAFARGIEQRLKDSKRLPRLPRVEMAARSTALAGSLISLLRWWLDHGANESAAAMDQLFHKMVWNGLHSGS